VSCPHDRPSRFACPECVAEAAIAELSYSCCELVSALAGCEHEQLTRPLSKGVERCIRCGAIRYAGGTVGARIHETTEWIPSHLAGKAAQIEALWVALTKTPMTLEIVR
jgi:hypothetical protein